MRLRLVLKNAAHQVGEITNAARSFLHLTALLTYLLTVSDTPESEFAKVFEKLGTYGKEALVSTADRIKERGYSEGIAVGEARGKVQMSIEILLNLMTAKFGALPTTAIEQVRSATSARIDTWTVRILTATTLEELLA